MGRFIARRLLQLIPMLLGITILSFFIIKMAPGDFFTRLSLNPNIQPQQLDAMRTEYWLDKPVYMQYLRWLYQAVQLDLGQSFAYHIPVVDLIFTRLFNTFILSFVTVVLTWLVAVPFGIYCAVHRSGWAERILSFGSFIGMSIPNFFFALLLLYLAASSGVLPVGGMRSLDHDQLSFLGQIGDIARHMVIPVMVLVTGSMASLQRIMRGNMLEELRAQYIVSARARGLSEHKVIYRHALRNAINPMITIFGYELSGLLSGAALTEIVCSWPGLGQLMLEAVTNQDDFVVMASLVMGAVLLVMGNLVADILLSYVDPRIRQA